MLYEKRQLHYNESISTSERWDMIRILMADGDYNARAQVRAAAEKQNCMVDEAENGIAAIKLFRRKEYDVALVDAYLPELDGLNVCRQMRKVSDLPIIFLSSASLEKDRLAAFDAGADDFLLKPFFASELMARIRVWQKRCRRTEKRSVLTAEGILVDLSAQEVYVDDSPVKLSPREYALLAFLIQHPNTVHSREALLDHVWGSEFEGTDRTVDTHVKALRKRIAPYDGLLKTVWGGGYKFEE